MSEDQKQNQVKFCEDMLKKGTWCLVTFSKKGTWCLVTFSKAESCDERYPFFVSRGNKSFSTKKLKSQRDSEKRILPSAFVSGRVPCRSAMTGRGSTLKGTIISIKICCIKIFISTVRFLFCHTSYLI